MTYYKVPVKLDQKRLKNGWFLVANELLTEKEACRRGVNTEKLNRIEISRRKIYWFFGVRFEIK